MNIVSAEINDAGVERIIEIVNNPSRLTQNNTNLSLKTPKGWLPVWIPGLTIPTVEFLDKPFGVQVEGDNEPFSTSITWRPDAVECIEASFTGYLTASEISKTGTDNDYKLRQVREKFDEICGHGGFLHAVVYLEEVFDDIDLYNYEGFFLDEENNIVIANNEYRKAAGPAAFRQVRSCASFMFNETTDEHTSVLQLMTKHGITPNDIVAAMKLKDLLDVNLTSIGSPSPQP